jgi:hypothetical protein
MAGVFALYGDIRTALDLRSRTLPGRTPAAQITAEFSEVVLASAQGKFDEAEQHLAKADSIARDFALAGAEHCLLGFAKVAIDRGDYVRASRLVAAVKASGWPQGRGFPASFVEALINDHCNEVLREVLDPESARSAQAEGAALSLKEALDAELIRGRTATASTHTA